MSFVTNSRGEKLLRDRLTEIVSQDDTIIVKSEHGSGIPVSRFLFNFYSSIILPGEVDLVLTQLSNENWASIVQTFCPKYQELGKDFFTDTAKENYTVFKTVTPKKIQSERESELTPPPPFEGDLSEKPTDGEAVETEDIRQNNVQEKVKVKKKMGRPKGTKGTKIGDPKIDWDHKDGVKYIENLTCQVCGKSFNHNQFCREKNLVNTYRAHFYQHELETTDCGCDNIQFKSSTDRDHHWKIVHKGRKSCKSCSRTYSSEDAYKRHNDSVHSERICDKCDFKTSRGSYYLKLHIRTIHEAKVVPGPINCSEVGCEKTFVTQAQRNQHFNKVHVLSTCHLCDKKVKILHRHIKLWHSEKKFQCDKCVKAFEIISKLTEHEKVEHQGLRYFCRFSDCKTKDQEYRDSSNRYAHERKRHGGNFKSRQ